jgi:hypothetical protein
MKQIDNNLTNMKLEIVLVDLKFVTHVVRNDLTDFQWFLYVQLIDRDVIVLTRNKYVK